MNKGKIMFKDLPDWLKKTISKSKCIYCKEKLVEEGVIGIGIRNSSQYKDITVFYYDYKCTLN